MFIELNDRVYLNTNKISRIKIEEIKKDITIRFFDGTTQIAKSQKFDSIKDAKKWISKKFK